MANHQGARDMTASIQQIHPSFAGEVTGVDCTRPLSAEDVAAIQAGMDHYGVLVFRNQPMSDEQQLAFTLHFGKLEAYNTAGHIKKKDDSRGLGAGIADFSNLDKSGNIISEQDRIWFFKLGDRLWHSDSSFRPVPAGYSLLTGRVVPTWGANTEFADMRMAYDALDDRTKELIRNNRFGLGFPPPADSGSAANCLRFLYDRRRGDPHALCGHQRPVG